MALPADYLAEWEDYPTTRVPDDPRGSHHGHPDLRFVRLCDEAERLHLTVGLAVGSQLYGADKERGLSGRRDLAALDVGPVGEKPLVHYVLGKLEGLGAAAHRALRLLDEQVA